MILSRAVAQSSLAVGCPIRAVMQGGTPLEGYKLSLQKRYGCEIFVHGSYLDKQCYLKVCLYVL